MTNRWHFIDDKGTFQLPDPQHTSYLYFPLLNEAGMVSSITPMLNGDAKTGQNSFLLLPTSAEDLHNSRSARNFWLKINGDQVWSATGNSAAQTAARNTDAEDNVTLTAGFLWHTITRTHHALGLQAEVTNFVPVGEDTLELMRVKITNTGEIPLRLTPTAAIPIYGRSADNLRDHRHVTSLLHRITCTETGVQVCPTLSFDERGHPRNETIYAVLGVEGDGTKPVGFFPDVESFVGEGGTLDWPAAVVEQGMPLHPAGTVVNGYEAMGGIRFKEIQLGAKEEKTYILVLCIREGALQPEAILRRFGTQARFEAALQKAQTYWLDKIGTLRFETGDSQFDNWLKWVALQPILRRRIGNSFLPYHDYGRGGRGWRDLWQDTLALLFMDTRDVGKILQGHFAGVRMDGSNATIIGINSGEFKADRNDIPRVWMDHGLWPLLTTHLYINQSGNLEFLLQDQVYFKDKLSHRARKRDQRWSPELGTFVQTQSGEVYRGSILEHMLVQHLTAFFNVGKHNNILLEDADWNDALDMANENGESVAFTAFYSGNLRILGELCQALAAQGREDIPLLKELITLLDTLSVPVDYGAYTDKRERLQEYFARTNHVVSGEQVNVPLEALAQDLFAKADWLAEHLRTQEWIAIGNSSGWFNSYYDNQGSRVEGKFGDEVRMMLSGQVFTLMFDIASAEQAGHIVQSADRYLFDETVGGYRLNTDFLEKVSGLGRVFGFAFGHKENGAMFSHMAMMYANALYKRKLIPAGWKVFKTIYEFSQDFSKSHMYPGIPEYFSQRGRGMYPYLTGSASWLLLTLLTEVFGVRGQLGDLLLEPKLMPEQFSAEGNTCVHTLFAGRKFRICYHNPGLLPYVDYCIRQVDLNGSTILQNGKEKTVCIPADEISSLPDVVTLDVYLDEI